MKTQLDQLDTEAMLLLYAVDELSPDDRRRVDAILQRDPQHRAQVEQLSALEQQLIATLAAADAHARAPVDSALARRRATRLVRQWVTLRPERPPTVVQKVVGLKYPWWTYPLTAAAAVVLAFLVWWGNTPMNQTPYAVQPALPEGMLIVEDDPEVSEEMQLAEDLERSFSHSSQERIRAVEGELMALSRTMVLDQEPEEPIHQEVNQ